MKKNPHDHLMKRMHILQLQVISFPSLVTMWHVGAKHVNVSDGDWVELEISYLH